MAATFSTHIRGYSANAFVDSLRIADISAWTTATYYTVGTIVYYSNKKYIAASEGTSGATPPTHSLGSVSDGTVSWIYMEPLNTDSNYKNNIYLYYAKKTEWTDEPTPDTPDVTALAEYNLHKNIIAIKKITAENAKLATRRYNWTSGIIYTPYDSAKDPLKLLDYPTPFYVMNSNFEIYKCLDNNNNSASTSEPTGSSLSNINTADGYVWFYMGTLTGSNTLLMSADYIPVESKTYNDGSDQWLVQQNAKARSISSFKIMGSNSTFSGSMTTTVYGDGSSATATAVKNGSNILTQVIPTNPGTNYTKDNTYSITKDSSATGSGATATARIDYNSILNYTVTNQGSGYTTASATITPVTTGSGATATPIIGTGGNAGKIVGLTITNPGKDYAGGAICTITGDGSNAEITLTINTSGIVGAITMDVGANGTGYTTANVIIVGDGSNAAATPVVSSNSISQINISNNGTGYTWAKVYIIPGTSGAVAYPIMAPVSGHGANIVTELATNTVLISSRIDSSTDVDYFEIDASGFRQVGIMCNVLDSSDADALGVRYIGPAHSEYSNVGSTLSKMKDSSGYFLYLNNIMKTLRVTNQDEDVKIAISY